MIWDFNYNGDHDLNAYQAANICSYSNEILIELLLGFNVFFIII